MTDRLHLSPRYRKVLLSLLQKHLPGVEVWAYGRRVNGQSHDGSDLDLVVRGPDLTEIPIDQLMDFEEAIQESRIPFLVEARDWSRLPARFHGEIERDYVIVDFSKPATSHVAGTVGGRTPSFSTSTVDEMCEFVLDCPHFTPEWTDEGFLVIRNQNIRNGRLNLTSPSYTHERDFARRIKRAKPRAGDIIFIREAPMGEVCLIPNGLECCLGQRQVLLRPKRGLSGAYLFYALQSPYVRHQILWSEGSGSTVSNVRIPALRALNIPRRPDEEAIAAFLKALDDKIEVNRRMNATLEAMARAVFKDWFVDFGPTRAKMDGCEPYLPPHIWDLFPDKFDDAGTPEGWNVAALGTAFHLLMGQSPPGDTYNDEGHGLPFFQGRADFSFRFPTNRKYCIAPNRVATPGDTLVSVRAPVGDINMASRECCIGRGVAAVRHNSGARSFTYYSVRALQTDLQQYEHTGTVFGAIRKTQFEALPTISPGEALVCAFEHVAAPLDARIEQSERESSTLTRIRALMLPQLMAGEFRLREPNTAALHNAASQS